MKDKIYEEYGIIVKYLIYKKDNIFFKYESNQYMIVATELNDNELKKIYKIIDYADNYAVFFHKIILNRHGYSFNFGQSKYVLLKLRITNNRLVKIDEILKVSNIKIVLNNQSLIESKIDFIEKYLANYEDLNLEELNYFIGLSENAIALFNLIDNKEKSYINHKRIDYNVTTLDFYNPLNIVIDFKTRDLAEYAKSLFINNDNKIIEFLKFLNYSEYFTYFARMLYPSFYFDSVDNYINNHVEIDKKRIRFLANSYEQNMKKLYILINNCINIPKIEWLANINYF